MIRLTAVGDIMLGRDIASGKCESAEDLLSDEVRSLLEGDLVTGNLECLLTESNQRFPYSHTHLKADPTFAATLLRRFHVVNLANNHAFDFMDQGLEDTLLCLNQLGVQTVGVGRNWEEALKPAVVERRGVKVAVFGMTTVSNIPNSGSRFVAAVPDDRALRRISEAKLNYDFVVVHLHAGSGDFDYPSPEVRSLHHRILQAGTDIVVGHHPHVVQGWEEQAGRLNFYSLGDFLFDRHSGGREYALIASVDLGEHVSCSVVPIMRVAAYRLTRLSAVQVGLFNRRLADYCQALATGRSDQLFADQMSASFGKNLTEAIRKDFAAAGVGGVFRRLTRLTPRKAMGLARTLLSATVRRLRN